MNPLLGIFLENLIRHGNLEVETGDGAKRAFGDGSGAPIAIRLADGAAERALMFDPEMALGELYMDGRLQVTRGGIYDVVSLAAENTVGYSYIGLTKALGAARFLFRRFHQRNGKGRAQANIAHHYDLDHRFYPLFLDSDLQYSCAYFERESQALEEAQLAKKRHLAAKLLVDERHSVLDIGCGFGGMALYLAQIAGARATGVTLSNEQFDVASHRAAEAGIADRLDFRLQDYRDVNEQFDRIVSVGMFEHIGAANYDEYFAKARELLKDDGVMTLHAIGRSEGPSATNPWIKKYIFPGGYIPALSEVTAAIERSGLFITDIEILRLHYADTLKAWRERFEAHRDEVRAMYDERFCRMWEFYLIGSEVAFRVYGHMVFQIQLAKRQDVAPLTRDYIGEREAQLRKRESQKGALWRVAS
ncbi:MAG: class I SAM-dependent methyltransferase [Bradyrhizobium sp.]|nr:MAG: class I SAM-dependent methyltransferase [Bradyrhizobium sp.]